MEAKIFTAQGEEKGSLALKDSVFGLKPVPELLNEVLKAYLANQRRGTAATKTRGFVSGGGRKPWRQKGTGRARAGSTRSPIWIGGGVTFGPRNIRNFSQRMPRKMVQQSIFMALSRKVKDKKLIIVDSFPFSKVKTKDIQAFLENLPIEEGKVLIILAKTNAFLELSAANLKYLTILQAQNINLIDILKNDYLVTDKEGINSIQKIFGSQK